jgi:hypothetical protein
MHAHLWFAPVLGLNGIRRNWGRIAYFLIRNWGRIAYFLINIAF